MLSINNMVQYFIIRCIESFMVKRFLSVFLSSVMMLGFFTTQVAHAATNSVTAARVWPAQDYTRITLEAGKPIVYKMTLLKDPERVVVDIDNVDVNPVLKSLSDKILGSDPYISQLRIARFKPGTVRLVVDLKAEVKPTIFTLPPAGDYKHRLVLDIYPGKDPLMTMLAELDQGAKSAEANAAAQPQLIAESTLQPHGNIEQQIITQKDEVKPEIEPAMQEVQSAMSNSQNQVTPAETAKIGDKAVEKTAEKTVYVPVGANL
jgi:N-acetylmuramoyl-L-alanine amidase